MAGPPVLPPLADANDVANALGVSSVTQLPSSMQIRMSRTLRKVSRRFRFEAQRFFTPGVYTHNLRIHAGAVRLMETPNQVVSVRIRGIRDTGYEAWQEGGLNWELWEEGGDPADFWEGSGYQAPGENFNGPGQSVWVTPDYESNINCPPPAANHPTPRMHVEDNWIRWSDWDFWRLSGRDVRVTYSWDTPVPEDVVETVGEIAARNLTIDPLSVTRQSKQLQSRHFRQEVADWVNSGETGFTKDDIEQAQAYRYPAPPVIIAQMASVDMEPSVAFLSDSSW